MKKRIEKYCCQLEEKLNSDEAVDWESAKREHLRHLEFYMHERLIHLMVTVTFGLFEVIVVAAVLISHYMYGCLLALAILILLFPYVFHYYFLENTVQKMYDQYDRICEKIR